MLLSYHECLENMVQIIKLKNIQEGHLFITEKGLYSEDRYVPELEIIMKNIRMQYWHLTAHFIIMDWPTPYRIIIMSQRPKVIRKIEDVRVKQIYENSNAFEMGKTTIEYDGVDL